MLIIIIINIFIKIWSENSMVIKWVTVGCVVLLVQLRFVCVVVWLCTVIICWFCVFPYICVCMVLLLVELCMYTISPKQCIIFDALKKFLQFRVIFLSDLKVLILFFQFAGWKFWLKIFCSLSRATIGEKDHECSEKREKVSTLQQKTSLDFAKKFFLETRWENNHFF